MWSRIAQLAFVIVVFGAASPPQPRHQHRPKTALQRVPAPAPLPCGDYLSFQVLLDRQGFSPGQIDGKPGPNLARALAALQSAHGLQPTGQPDCDAWRTLGGDDSGSMVTTYTISEDDLKGPFEERIPRELMEQAKLSTLGYQSPLERLAEKFHASPALLQQMNAGVRFTPGTPISVPAVQPFDAASKPVPDAAADDITLLITRAGSDLKATRQDGTIVFFAPVTTGSQHDPLPEGDWKVTGVQWYPEFHYNPDLFWDAKPGDGKATLKPGPNNPVGVVWIALSLEHYGLHGTAEPGHIGHTESHGCVRLTNWDAARVASLVKPGTPVLFR